MAVDGRYVVTMVLPRWTVVNEFTFVCHPDGTLTGTCDTRDDSHGPAVHPIKWGFWNKDFFHICVDVGPGAFEAMGRVSDTALTGVVTIDHVPDSFCGVRLG